MNRLSEDLQRKLVAFVAWGSWLVALTLTGIVTYVNVTRPITLAPTFFQRVAGSFIVVLIGTGIGAGLALSRMKLADTIANAFAEGYRAGTGKGPKE